MSSFEGETNPVARLTNATVREIRSLYLMGNRSYLDLAWQFGVHKSTVQQIINCMRWDHLLEPGQAQALSEMRDQRNRSYPRQPERKNVMSVEVKQSKSTEQKIAERLRPSHCEGADSYSRQGDGPTRVSTAVHHAGHYVQPGTAAKPTQDGRVASVAESKKQQSGAG